MDKLLQLLSTNSQFSTAEISAMLGEPEDYIKAQIKEYESQGIIKGYQAVVNWEDVEAQMCMAFEEVDSVYLMAGVYDFALIVKGETMQDIAMFVAKKLSTVDGVLSTGTHFIMRRYKDRGMNLFGADNRADERSLIL